MMTKNPAAVARLRYRIYAKKPLPSGCATLRFLDSIDLPETFADLDEQMARLLRHRLRAGESVLTRLIAIIPG